jgi:hypothetical protein
MKFFLQRLCHTGQTNFVPFVNCVRTRISPKFPLPEKEISDQGDKVHEVQREDCLATFHIFSVSPFASRLAVAFGLCA